MRGRWLDSHWNTRDTGDDEPARPAPFTTTEMLKAAKADEVIRGLVEEIADIVVDRQAAWRRHAACAGSGPDLWFPEQGDTFMAADAVEVCRTCPVAVQCDEYATSRHLRHGVWGGKAGRNRNRGAWDRGAA